MAAARCVQSADVGNRRSTIACSQARRCIEARKSAGTSRCGRGPGSPYAPASPGGSLGSMAGVPCGALSAMVDGVHAAPLDFLSAAALQQPLPPSGLLYPGPVRRARLAPCRFPMRAMNLIRKAGLMSDVSRDYMIPCSGSRRSGASRRAPTGRSSRPRSFVPRETLAAWKITRRRRHCAATSRRDRPPEVEVDCVGPLLRRLVVKSDSGPSRAYASRSRRMLSVAPDSLALAR